MDYNETYIRAKEKAAQLFKGKHDAQGANQRIPPGQVLTQGFPVLDLGVKPDFDPQTWKLRVFGLVEKERTFSYDELLKLPASGLTADFHCLAPGTFVFTKEGGKNIEDIQVGDFIVGQDGMPHLVERLLRKKHDGFLLNIKATYLPAVCLTPDHKIWVVRSHPGIGKTKSRRRKMTFNENPKLMWVEANDVKKGDYVFFPKYQYTSKEKFVKQGKRSFAITKELASVLGWYVAEGSAGDSKGRCIRFSLNASQNKESRLLSDKLVAIFEANVSTYQQHNTNSVTITSSKIDNLLAILKEWCGNDAFSKKIPSFILSADKKILAEFLRSLIEGDGYRPWLLKMQRSQFSKENFIDVTTASRTLAYQLLLAFSKLGIPSGIVKHPGSVNDAYSVRIHSFNQINKLIQTSQGDERINRNKYHETEEGFYYPIQKIERIAYSGEVYDFTAEGLTMLSPFVTLDCVTHWTKLGVQWKGISLFDFEKIAKPKPEWKHLIQYSADGYSSNVPREDLERDNVLLAYELEGKPIPREHGWPVRLIIPHLYGWKGAKFVNALEFSATDKPGFWETRGYHNHGDAFAEERYSQD